jgi:hypothetical protein
MRPRVAARSPISGASWWAMKAAGPRAAKRAVLLSWVAGHRRACASRVAPCAAGDCGFSAI